MYFINIFLMFMIYSIFGYFYEILVILCFEKKIEIKRGFLLGPYIPIYGFGMMFMTLFLFPLKDNIIMLFLASLVSAGILEYMTSYVMEKIYGYRWWDYSDDPFNINGRITLSILILFGIGGILVVNYIAPFITNLLNNINNTTLFISALILGIIILTDLYLSTYISFKIKANVLKKACKDSTKFIKEETYNYIKKVLKNKS
ncbi:MAG: putative ABC transporter permease [bacterium]